MASKDPNWTPMFRKRRDNSSRKAKSARQLRSQEMEAKDGVVVDKDG